MRFAFAGGNGSAASEPLAADIRSALTARGHECVDSGNVDLVFNLTDAANPRSHYLRPDASVFVASLVDSDSGDGWDDREALRNASYGLLVKTMSNVVIHRVREGKHGGQAYYVTPELGFRAESDANGLGESIADFVTPLAEARVVIENDLVEDLPPALHEGDEAARALMAFGRTLAGMNLLPSVFDLNALLSERDMRMLHKVFGIKQLSYGNLSVRRDENSFWMSGRGVNKGDLKHIGSDLFLVTGYDPARAALRLSVPPGTDKTGRVSVDAIEHWKVYEALPDVGAIVHVHAWMDGIEATTQSWPCGTEQLADEVLAIIQRQPDPTRAVAGLKNHGLTITGTSLEDIFERIDGKLTQDIPVLD